MLIQANLPKKLWAEAINTATYIRNRCPTGPLNDQTLYEVWNGAKPSVRHRRRFGCKAYMLDKRPTKGKFDPKSIECIFVGYSNESKAYRIWDVSSNKIIQSRDVRFVNNFVNTAEFKEEYNILNLDLKNPEWH